MLPLPLIGGAVGALGGLLGGKPAPGNVYSGGNAENVARDMAMSGQGITTKGLSQSDATADVQSNPMLSQLFGQGGILSQTAGQETQQANQPWALTPEDRSSYGQASGDIARMFGQSDKSLASSLAQRGMSSSNPAMAAFSGSAGNKMEQLGKLQTDIANKRQAMNMQRLQQTQNFLSQMTGQGLEAVGQSQRGAQMGNEALAQKSQLGQNYLGGFQKAAEAQAGASYNAPQQALMGAAGGALGGANLGSALSGGPKFNTNTGAAMFDPQTGKKYG